MKAARRAKASQWRKEGGKSSARLRERRPGEATSLMSTNAVMSTVAGKLMKEMIDPANERKNAKNDG